MGIAKRLRRLEASAKGNTSNFRLFAQIRSCQK